jgi:hypothetical protein
MRPDIGRYRVIVGREIEKQVRDLLNLAKPIKNLNRRHPDIYDGNDVGEIKAISERYELVLYSHQITKYRELVDELNSCPPIDGKEKHVHLAYYIARYSKHKKECYCGCCENEKCITDIYVLGDSELRELEKSETTNTRWNIKPRRIMQLRALDDKRIKRFEPSQANLPKENKQKTIYSVPKAELARRIHSKNIRGAYIRPKIYEVEALCPKKIIVRHICVHYNSYLPVSISEKVTQVEAQPSQNGFQSLLPTT